MDMNWNIFFLCLSRISCNFTVSVFEQFAQIAHELSILGDTENTTGQGPEQPPWFDPALSRNGGAGTPEVLSDQCSCDYVIIRKAPNLEK